MKEMIAKRKGETCSAIMMSKVSRKYISYNKKFIGKFNDYYFFHPRSFSYAMCFF